MEKQGVDQYCKGQDVNKAATGWVAPAHTTEALNVEWGRT